MKVIILTASTMKKTIDGKEFSGKCVTGYDWVNNRVLRFVGNKDGAPMGNPFCDQFNLLDVFDIPVLGPCPKSCQTENVLGDYGKAEYLGKYEGGIDTLYKKMQTMILPDGSFMWNRSYKLNNVSSFTHSLELIKVTDLKKIDGQPKKCEFLHNGKACKFFSVTDPEFANMESYIGNAYLAISIPSDGYEDKGFFKFIAAIYPYRPNAQSTKEQEIKNDLSIIDQLRLISEGVNPMTGALFDFDELSKDETACHYSQLLAYKMGLIKKTSPGEDSLNLQVKQIYERLRKWRLEVANAQGVPAFCVFSNKDLLEIASGDIKNKEELINVKGVGPKRYDLYGEAIFDILKEFI